MKIKVCGLNNTANIGEVLSCEPDYIGFIFYRRSPRYISGKVEPVFSQQITDKVKKVGVFVNESVNTIIDLALGYQLEMVQLHGNEDADVAGKLKSEGLEVIKAFSVGENFSFRQLEAYEECCNYFLFDTAGEQRGGTGIKFNWALLENYKGTTPFFLSGGIGPEDGNLIKRLDYKMLAGLDINSKFEISPGVKDIPGLRKFINEIRSNDGK